MGEAIEQEGASNRLLIFGIAAGIGILLLLQAAFRNMRLALLFFLTLPMALVGGVLMVYVTGRTMSLGSYVGFLAVFGIAARNGILLINHCQHLERHEGERFGPGLVLRGASERLSPIMMTALATALALVAAGRGRHDPRTRDRAPDGARDPGRPGHVDLREPLRGPLAVPALRARRRVGPGDRGRRSHRAGEAG
jgi:multidrug efflux pump subunit AcrB